jgi:hypothetical protein
MHELTRVKLEEGNGDGRPAVNAALGETLLDNSHLGAAKIEILLVNYWHPAHAISGVVKNRSTVYTPLKSVSTCRFASSFRNSSGPDAQRQRPLLER